MNLTPTPPGTTEDVRASSVLVLAPHYDDEVLGCGGLLARLADAGAAVRVLFLSDSGGPDGDGADARRAYSARRRAESRQAIAALGLAGADELGLPDGELDQHLDKIAAGVRRALLTMRPELLLVTSPLELSLDHRATFAAVHRLLGGVRPGGELWPLVRHLKILAYDVNQPLHPDLLVDVGGQVERVEAAMACYPSQQERHDYLSAYLGLARYRTHTLPPAVTHAEGYRRLTLDDFTTRDLAALITELGGAAPKLVVESGPTISVIVRTKDRPQLLSQALSSLAASSYRRAEVVLVNDGGAPPAVPGDFPLAVKRVDLAANQGRAAAANAGLAAATGDCVVFLDDDDLVFAEHLETLAGLISAEGVRVAYTDAAVGVYELDEGGWTCTERRLPYRRDFDPDLLLLDNYIPFNTVVVNRELALEVGELDTGLEFFEDWDFLLRLAARTPFHHLARATCEYRQFRGAGHHVLGDTPRRRANFLAMKARVIEKHRQRLTPEVAARVVDRLRGEAVAAAEDAAALRTELDKEEERGLKLNGKIHSLELHQAALEEAEQRAREEIDALRRHDRDKALLLEKQQGILEEQEVIMREQGPLLAERQRLLDEQTKAIDQLRALIRAMESTRAWRLHQWWQEHKPGGPST
jgi:LmbE family N-acetylglucosaminyl deacetylase